MQPVMKVYVQLFACYAICRGKTPAYIPRQATSTLAPEISTAQILSSLHHKQPKSRTNTQTLTLTLYCRLPRPLSCAEQFALITNCPSCKRTRGKTRCPSCKRTRGKTRSQDLWQQHWTRTLTPLRFASGEGAQRRSGWRIFGAQPKSLTPKGRAFSGAHEPPSPSAKAAHVAWKRGGLVGAAKPKHICAPGAEEPQELPRPSA